jgi:hypothetical protein
MTEIRFRPTGLLTWQAAIMPQSRDHVNHTRAVGVAVEGTVT